MLSLLFGPEPAMKIVQNNPLEVDAKDPGLPYRERKMSVTRRRPDVAEVTKTLTVESEQEAQIVELVEFWDSQYQKTFDMPDASMSKYLKRNAVEDLLDEVKDPAKIKRFIVTLLADKRASWVNNKTLTWLASARNRTFLAPMLLKAGRAAEFRGQRSTKQTFTFRK